MPTIHSAIVELIVFRFVHDRAEFLLLKRSDGDALYPGIWQNITGSVHEGETALAAALRELAEETSLSAERLWVVPFTGSFYDFRTDLIHLTPFFAAQVSAGSSPLLSHEHAAFEWLPYDTARRRLVWPGQRDALEIVHGTILRGEEAALLAQVK